MIYISLFGWIGEKFEQISNYVINHTIGPSISILVIVLFIILFIAFGGTILFILFKVPILIYDLIKLINNFLFGLQEKINVKKHMQKKIDKRKEEVKNKIKDKIIFWLLSIGEFIPFIGILMSFLSYFYVFIKITINFILKLFPNKKKKNQNKYKYKYKIKKL